MNAFLRVATRNLLRHRVRLAASVGGVALALSLVLALDAILVGVSNQLTSYIDRSRADVWVGQAGVRNLHMVASWLPASVVDEVAAVPGVGETTAILYVTDSVTFGAGTTDERTSLAYVIGLPDDALMGTAWEIAAGAALPQPGTAVVDRGAAESASTGIGDMVEILGRDLRISGLSEGTATLTNSVAFINAADFATARGDAPLVSFVLVRAVPGADPEALGAAIEDRVDGVTALTREAFAAEERGLVMDMSIEVVTIMNSIGFLIGLAVVALTVYVANLARRGEYGMLKAVGARNRFLYGVVLTQAVLSVALGLAVGVSFTLLLGAAVTRAGLNVELALSIASLTKVGALALLIAGLASILPIKQIAGLDPAVVFRRGAT
jgi:putative ABC transport system permease protein